VDWSYDEAVDPCKATPVVRAYLTHYGRIGASWRRLGIHNGGPRGYRKQATLAYAGKSADLQAGGNRRSRTRHLFPRLVSCGVMFDDVGRLERPRASLARASYSAAPLLSVA
jgi:hypothetical protein